jgi:hypothetical protein
MKIKGNAKIISEIRKANIENLKVVSAKTACQAVSCKPAQEFLEKVCEKHKEVEEYKENIKKGIIRLEKRIYEFNLHADSRIWYKRPFYPQVKNIVGLTIYLLTPFTQKECYNFTNITSPTIREYSKKLHLKKPKNLTRYSVKRSN